MTMTKANIRFIRNELIPFILRDHGRGFMMDLWHFDATCDYADSCTKMVLRRNDPSCSTVCCIGGSIQHLLGKSRYYHSSNVGSIIGLTPVQSSTLFFGHRVIECSFLSMNYCSVNYCYPWPLAYRRRYKSCKTPLGRAKVAAALLEAVCKTNGKVLDPP